MSEKLRKIKDKASKAFGDGKLKDALKLYQQAVEEDPTELACRIKIGDIYRRLDSKAQAVAAYEPVARHYAEDGLLLKAIAVCKLILSVDASHTATQEMLANLYSKRAVPLVRSSRAAPAQVAEAVPGRAVTGGAFEIEIDEDDSAEPMVVERSATSVVTVGGDGGGGAVPPAPSFAWPTAQVIMGSKVEDASAVPPAVAGVPVIMGAKVDGPGPAGAVGRGAKRDVKAAAEAAADAAAEAVARALAEGSVAAKPAEEAGGAAQVASAWPVAGGATGATGAAGGSMPIEVALVDIDEAEEVSMAGEPAMPAAAAEAAPSVIVAEEATGSGTLEEIFEHLDEGTPRAGLAASAPSIPAEPADAETHPIELSKIAKSSGGTDDLAHPQIPLFSDLPKDAFIEILVQMHMREMTPGEFVITEGEVGDSFFVLAQGKVRVSRRADDGSETILAYLTDGAFFGEMALLQDGARTASVIVEEESQIFELSKPILDRVVAQYPTVAKVLRNFYTQRLLSTTMATHPLFKSFGPAERRALMERFKSKQFKSQDVLLEEDKKGEGLYLLLTGTLEVTKQKDGAPIVIAELVAGDMFGEISLLTNKPTVATVKALTECFVLRLSKKHFDELIMTHPQVLEYVAQISEERQTENSAIFGAWNPMNALGAALV